MEMVEERNMVDLLTRTYSNTEKNCSVLLRLHQIFFAVHSDNFFLQCSDYYLLTQINFKVVWR